jgi:S1-C subfamily serine protease/Tfp pilus assembly protein PilF
VYRRTLPAVGWVQSAERARGTGWVVDRERRWLITCYHVIGDNDTVEVSFPVRRDGEIVSARGYYLENAARLRKEGRVVTGRVLRRNRDTDLALVELDSLPPDVRALPLAPESARPGDVVQGVGNRYDLEVLWTHSGGVVQQIQTLHEGYFSAGKQVARGARVLLGSVPINEGDSGGPLVDCQGRVVGVSAAVSWEARGAGLFIDVTAVRALLGDRESPAEKPAPGADESTGRAVYAQGVRSVVLVQYEGGERSTGVIIDRARRLVLTTAEAVGKEERVEVIFPVIQGEVVEANWRFYQTQKDLLTRKHHRTIGVVLASDPRRNLALVDVGVMPEGATAVSLAARVPEPGDRVHLITNPRRLGVVWLYGAGSIRQRATANLGQTPSGAHPGILVVQAPLLESEGGGPVFDGRGDLVALTSGRVGPQQQLAYALLAEEVRGFLAESRPQREPRSAAEFVRRAWIHVKARQLERARRDAERAIALDAGYAPAWGVRGWVEHLDGGRAFSLADLDRAVRLDAAWAEGWARRSLVRGAAGDGKGALADSEQAVKRDERSALARTARGGALLLLGQPERALVDCDEAVWLDRRLALALVVRGRVHLGRGEAGKALADFEEALHLEPGQAEVHRLKGEAHWANNQTRQAVEEFSRTLASRPNDVQALLGRGRARAVLGERAEALADLDKALGIDPALVDARLARAAVRLREGTVQPAVADYREVLRRRPAERPRLLGEVARRAAELLGDREDPSGCGELVRQVLESLAEMVRDPVVVKRINEGLAAARRESDSKQRARRLLETLEKVRDSLEKENRR